MSKILVLQGHPDPAGGHLCHALADSCAAGAAEGGHEVRRIEVARLDFPLLHTQEAFEKGAPPPPIKDAQEALLWADHLVLIFPLWLGALPALFKGFLEQTLRPGFAFSYRERGFPVKLLKGRSVRIVITMGMPALAYRWWFGAHGLKNLRRNILSAAGFGPVRDTLFGSIGAPDAARAARMLADMREFGRRAG